LLSWSSRVQTHPASTDCADHSRMGRGRGCRNEGEDGIPDSPWESWALHPPKSLGLGYPWLCVAVRPLGPTQKPHRVRPAAASRKAVYRRIRPERPHQTRPRRIGSHDQSRNEVIARCLELEDRPLTELRDGRRGALAAESYLYNAISIYPLLLGDFTPRLLHLPLQHLPSQLWRWKK
jgi:hypothetical protein